MSGSERYINIILKVEEMLKSWFPHVKPAAPHSDKPPGGDTQFPSKKQKVMPAPDTHPASVCVCVCVCVCVRARVFAR